MERLVHPAVVLTIVSLSACQPQNDPGESKGGTPIATYDAVDAIEIVESPATGVALGWGWNRGDSEPIPTICVEFVPGEEPAQTRYMTMNEVNDSYELMESLGVSAEASVKAIGYEVEGKASFAKSQDITSSKSTFVLNVVVQNGVRYAAPVPYDGEEGEGYQPAVNERGGSRGAIRLTPDALKLALGSLEDFKRACGSSFVSAIYGGAKLTATLSFSAVSKTQKETLKAEMSGGGWGARFKGKVENASTEGSESERMDVSIFMTGGRGDSIPATKDDLLTKLGTVSMDAYVAPKDFQVAITPYELLSNWPGRILPDKETEFEELASYWGAYNTLYDEIQQVLDQPGRFVDLTVDADGKIGHQFCLPEYNAVNEVRERVSEEVGEALKNEEKWKKALNVYPRLWLSTSSLTQALSGVIDRETLGAVNRIHGELTRKENALWNCLADPMSGGAVGLPDREKLERAQDEVLAGLKRMEEEARGCSDRSDTCDFEAESYRSPYAFRIQLPVPVDAELQTFDDVIYYKIGRLAKSRCEISANNPGCLSNAEIAGWAHKTGLVSVSKSVHPDRFARYESMLADARPKFVPAGMSVLEQGRTDVLWYNPNTPEPQNHETEEPSAESTEAE